MKKKTIQNKMNQIMNQILTYKNIDQRREEREQADFDEMINRLREENKRNMHAQLPTTDSDWDIEEQSDLNELL